MINKNIYELFNKESKCSKYAIVALFIIFISSYTAINKYDSQNKKIYNKNSDGYICKLIEPNTSFVKKVLYLKIKDLMSYDDGTIGNICIYSLFKIILLSFATYYIHRYLKNRLHKFIFEKSKIDDYKKKLIKTSELASNNLDSKAKFIQSEELSIQLNKTTSQIRFCSFISCILFGCCISIMFNGEFSSTRDVITLIIFFIIMAATMFINQNIFLSNFMPVYIQIKTLKGFNKDDIFNTLYE